MKKELYEITKQGKDYGKFATIVKEVKKDVYRVVTLDGFRTVCHIDEMEKVY